MIIGLCTIELRPHWANSLKDKRSEIKSLISRVRAKFNVSIAEIDCHDQWRTAVLGFVTISTDRSYTDRVMAEVVDFVEGNTEAELVTVHTEII